MAFEVSRLRRWFAVAAIAMTAIVVMAYYYAKWRVENALKQVPHRIGLEIQQSAQGFTISKSEAGHTLFKVQASKAVQYKQGGHAELNDVNITLYGTDSSRFDQIHGSHFEYDPQSGDVSAKGEVQIDLEAHPEGLKHPDQALPKELKNPIHLKTSGLVFNHKSGEAFTKERIEFRIPQAQGSAIGATYSSKTNILTLESQIVVEVQGNSPATLTAARATVAKDPQVVTLERTRVRSPSQWLEAGETRLFLRQDNTLDRVLASGQVRIESRAQPPARIRAAQLEVVMAQPTGIRSAVFSGEVRLEASGSDAMEASSERVVVAFAEKNLPRRVQAEGDVHLVQHQKPSRAGAGTQELELTAPAVDLLVVGGHRLGQAATSGASQLVMRSSFSARPQPLIRVSAAKFEAKFNSQGRLALLRGAPDARIVSSSPGEPDQVSTSRLLDAVFRGDGGIESIEQQGDVSYQDGENKAHGERSRYTPADRMLVLSGSPRVEQGNLTITANVMRLNRRTGEASAEGEVKSTYRELKPQPDGGLLTSSDPIHATARSVTVHRSPPLATYIGNARLWQGANVVEAPSLTFDREHRSVVADSLQQGEVSTILVQAGAKGTLTPVTITSSRLAYVDREHKIHFDGAVAVKGSDLTITAKEMDVFLQGKGEVSVPSSTGGPTKLDRIVARGHVEIAQPGRKANGEQLVYLAAEDKFVLSGGSPSIFDAEHGKITGVSLTFFRHDDRVLVEGDKANPVITQTRVAR